MRGDGRIRTWLAVLGSLLLPVPLVWLFVSLPGGYSMRTAQTPALTLVPMLPPAEREGTLTYGRECRTHDDCDSQLRCFSSLTLESRYCMDSDCVVDKHCPEGFSCQTYPVRQRPELIRICSVVGRRQEGELCSEWTRDPERGCERGLLCHTRCGRPCDPDDPSTCPEGFFCEKARAGAACQPTCEGRACPEGERCIGVGGKRSICARVHGKDCQSEPCAPGQYCSVSTYPQPAREVWMQCTQGCGRKGAPACPEGTICEDNQCLARCSPDGRCDEGFKCTDLPEGPAVCTLDIPRSSP
ncbi:hypothetical protein CYFUS_009786 [Cystobacter fuscus]|uniref:Uncharacterized protein n=1 Tax=Cystobacter fuscus TaxID=43 RepID=A0A250JK95_9BACT|nr:hypothetical protein CYFUS_009786 [Cystobacter fuscus]